LEQHLGYSVPELARRFDRSVTWVSRRLGLVELLPEAIQQQVRERQIAAQMAMKYLVPVARHLYAAWRRGSAAVRKRILDDPALFFKTQRQPKGPLPPN
jgi:ParB family transcriptional regulator, chromosome partitioning protein